MDNRTFEKLLMEQKIEYLINTTEDTMTFYSEDGTPIIAHLTEDSEIFFTVGEGVRKLYLINSAELSVDEEGKRYFSGSGYTNHKYIKNEFKVVKLLISEETDIELYSLIPDSEEE